MSVIPVVASVVHERGKVLICQRPAEKRHGGLWEFPGGKLHDGEDFSQAIARELDEELGMSVTEIGPLLQSIPDPGGQFVIHFVAVETNGEPQLLEHEAVAWVQPDRLREYELAPADEAFAVGLASSLDDREAGPRAGSALTGQAEVTVWTAVALAARSWGTTTADLSIQFECSTRMTRALGRCYPKRRLIRLNSALFAPRFASELAEVAVHEAAHVVARDKNGAGIRPHGPEWQALVRSAGFEPTIRLDVDLPVPVRRTRPRARVRYEHRCPVCHARRSASRPMRRWRCAVCLEAGLPGELEITSTSTRKSRS